MPVNYHNNEEGNKWWCQERATRFGKQWGQKSLFFLQCWCEFHLMRLAITSKEDMRIHHTFHVLSECFIFHCCFLDWSDYQVLDYSTKNGQHNPKPIVINQQSKQCVWCSYNAAYSLFRLIMNSCCTQPKMLAFPHLYILVVVLFYCNTAVEPRGWLNFIFILDNQMMTATTGQKKKTPMQVHNWTTNNLHASTWVDKHWPST